MVNCCWSYFAFVTNEKVTNGWEVITTPLSMFSQNQKNKWWYGQFLGDVTLWIWKGKSIGAWRIQKEFLPDILLNWRPDPISDQTDPADNNQPFYSLLPERKLIKHKMHSATIRQKFTLEVDVSLNVNKIAIIIPQEMSQMKINSANDLDLPNHSWKCQLTKMPG